MKLGIGSYTYVWSVGIPGYPDPARPLTAFDLLDRAADLGVRVVQIADNLPLDRLPPGELTALRRRAEPLGLTLEVGTRGVAPDRLNAYLEIAVALGAKLVRTLVVGYGESPDLGEAVERICAVAPSYERAGVTLAVENQEQVRAATLAELFDRVGSPAVGFCLDTANSIGCLEGVDVLLGHCGRWLCNVHLKDYAVTRPPHQKGFVVEGRPVGRGQLDVPQLLDVVRATGRDANVILEMWTPPAAAAEEEAWARESVRFLREFIPD